MHYFNRYDIITSIIELENERRSPMIYVEPHIIDKIDSLNYDNLYVVADFDRTITINSSHNSWSILEESNFICEEYTRESIKLYKKYYPIEFNFNIDPIIKDKLMIEWWSLNIDLFVKYRLKEEIVNNAISNIEIMEFRGGGKEFLENLYKENIPLIIISAGIGNFIEQFLRYNDCLFSNIHIISNFIKFKNGIAVDIGNDIIHSQNKNIVSLPQSAINKISGRKNILLLGDNLADVKMVPENKRNDTIRIGFLDSDIEININRYKECFDIVCTHNASFHDLARVLRKK
jgi:5'-nucleotidase